MSNRNIAILDLTDCQYLGELHKRIKVALEFPDHYGENWDAFWDLIWSECDADKVITVLKSYHLNNLMVVLNKVRGDLLVAGECLTPDEVTELLKTPVGALLPEEHTIYRGDLSEIHASFRLLAGNLLTGRRRLYDVTRKYSGFFGNIRRVLKRRL